MRVVMAGGGTGGHIFPAVAIAERIKEIDPEAEILFLGSEERMESRIVPKLGFRFVPIKSAPLPRSPSPKAIVNLVKLVRGVSEAVELMRDFRPDAAVVTGGYVCAPVSIASAILKIPLFIQEQNALPGLANRMAALWAEAVFLGFEEAIEFLPRRKAVVTGNPIRRLNRVEREEALSRLGLRPELRTIFVMGGSQGAGSISDAVIGALNRLSELGVQLIHQTGARDLERVRKAYELAGIEAVVEPFFEDMGLIYSAADLMISRAGGMTIAEMTSFGLPAILIPFPYAAGDHQRLNALSLQRAGAAILIPEDELSPSRLAEAIGSILSDEGRLSRMREASLRLGRPEAAAEIVEIILRRIGKG